MENKNRCESESCSITDREMKYIKELNVSKPKVVTGGITIIVFSKIDCSICKATIEKLNIYLKEIHSDIKTFYYNLDTLDGLTEAAVYSAFDVPTVVVEDNGKEIKRWRELPSQEEFKNVCSKLS